MTNIFNNGTGWVSTGFEISARGIIVLREKFLSNTKGAGNSTARALVCSCFQKPKRDIDWRLGCVATLFALIAMREKSEFIDVTLDPNGIYKLVLDANRRARGAAATKNANKS